MSERFTITVAPEGAGPPPDVRLRRLLKAALRSFKLRVVDVHAVDETTEQPQPKETSP